jgi:oligopeptide/dipeptide ABC transporter ATP-binding protein
MKRLGMSLVLITHDLGIVAEMASEVLVMYAGKIVESAKREELFEKPLHPYTQGLLRCLPSSEKKRGEFLDGIKGMVPDLIHLGPGCAFADRCEKKSGRCLTVEPALEQKREGHWVRCIEV